MDWLGELCLRQGKAEEVQQELTLIMDQVQHIRLQPVPSAEPYWSSLQEASTNAATINSPQKDLVKLFLKRYYRLLCNCLNKMERASGMHKLKYLITTTLNSIFT